MTDVREALRELVDVKAIKEQAEALHFAGPLSEHGEQWKTVYDNLRAEYLRRQPIAWANARAALSTPEGVDARWIPVSERLPEPEVDVLCFGPNRVDQKLPWLMFVDWFGSKSDCGRGVTHWMPLPAPPMQKDQESRT